MSKALRSYPEGKRTEIAARRIARKAGGIGTLAAQDYMRRKSAPVTPAPKKAEVQNENA